MKPRPFAAVWSAGLCVLTALPPNAARAQCEFRFGPEQSAQPLSGRVFAAAVWDPDGPGPRPACLVVGGSSDLGFDGAPFHSIAMYEDGQWGSLGAGLPGGIGEWNGVRALAVLNGDLIAAGTFVGTFGGPPTLRRVARFNGTEWLPLGLGMDLPVNALAVLNGALYAAGEFSAAGGLPAERVARWDGASWSPLGPGIHGPLDVPRAMTVFGGALVVGGDISMAGGLPMSNLAVWNGVEWSSPGAGVNDTVRALAVHDNGATLPTLVVGGDFTMAGGIPAPHIARRNSFGQWSAFGAGLNRAVTALLVRNSGLAGYTVIATVDPISSSETDVVLQFSGGSWTPIGSLPARPSCIVYHNFAYTVGSWSGAGKVHAFDGAGWSPVGPGLSGPVYALQPFGTDLIFGGEFEYAHGQRVNRIARWDGSAWFPMVNGMNGEVTALGVSQGSLYAAGAFSVAGSAPTNNIARWNGAGWAAAGLPEPAAGDIRALAEFNGELIVGGSLDGGRLVRRLAGNTWVDMSAGLAPGEVLSFGVLNGDLYAGAHAQVIGTTIRSAVSRWDPVAQLWLEVQADPGASSVHWVAGLVPFEGALYAAGFELGTGGGLNFPFAAVGPSSFQALPGIAQSGPTGNALPSGAGWTLMVYEGRLHAIGVFNLAGGNPADGFARLDPAGWTPIAGAAPVLGPNGIGAGSAAAVYQGELVSSLIPFGPPVHRWARWHCPAPCYPDCNSDGVLTVADFGCFQTKFVAGDPYADCNGDGVRTVADFGCFQTKFVAGCP